MKDALRRSAIAGSWYPGDPTALAAELDSHLRRVNMAPHPGRLVGVVSPHAGLRYSGAVAAYAHAPLRGLKNVTAVLVGPSHRFAYAGVALWARGAFETPLGQIPIDEELAGALLAASPLVLDAPRPHVEEHSLEMQLPFLQHVCPGLQIVPALMGAQGEAEIDAMAEALAAAVPRSKRRVILVASSDLSHYHPAATANALDALVAEDVGRFDPAALQARVSRNPEHACGGGPTVAVMKASLALGARLSRVLRYADSGDAGERNKERVVGYLAAAFVEPA